MNDGGSQTDGATAQEGLRFLHRADNGTQLSCLEIMLTHIPFFPYYGHLKKNNARVRHAFTQYARNRMVLLFRHCIRREKSICVISAFFLP